MAFNQLSIPAESEDRFRHISGQVDDIFEVRSLERRGPDLVPAFQQFSWARIDPMKRERRQSTAKPPQQK
jgi:hypothetical protein